MSNTKTLFADSDQEDDEPIEFRTNKSYAEHYDQFRKKEILSQLKNLDQEESESSEDETTDEEIVDEEFDKEFFRTMAFLKRTDPSKYKEQPTFFENVKPVEEVALTKRHHKEKPMTLKDYERKILLEQGGVYKDEDDAYGDSDRVEQRAASPTMVEQEAKIKDDIKQALSKIDDSDEEENLVAHAGGLLAKSSKSKDEREKEKADYIQWLADKKAKEPPTKELKDLEPLKHYWNKEKLSKEDAFLKDYILNKRFVQNGDAPTYDDIVATSEDEEELEKQEEYERKYNFRFEEPDPEFIKRYPRSTDESMRIERNKRKEQRQALKERKQKEKEQQRRELEELKAIKLQEIKDRILRLKEIAATENVTMNEADLESDFDPNEHDRRMQEMFNDEYYGVDEGDEKPEFRELDEELGIENYDKPHIDDYEEMDDTEPHCEDDDFVMDCDYEENLKKDQQSSKTLQQEVLESTRGRKKGRRQSKFREALKAKKPLFDPADEKTFGEYIEEYYKLDYEDMIGDTPCRFKYVETVPNDFGLSIEEILAADTRDLNRWASVKKTVQIRPKDLELKEVESYRRKGVNDSLKRKMLPSLFKETDINEEEDKEIKEQKNDLQTNGVKADVQESQQSGKKKIFKPKVPFTETDNNVEESVKIASRNKTHKKGARVQDDSTASATRQKQTPDKPKQKLEPSADIAQEGPSGRTIQRGSNPNHSRKRSWGHSSGASPADRKQNSFNGEKKGRFAQNGPTKGKSNGNWSSKSNKPESASDQRLRAFGINPRKFRDQQKYGKQHWQNSTAHISNSKPLNKITKFE